MRSSWTAQLRLPTRPATLDPAGMLPPGLSIGMLGDSEAVQHHPGTTGAAPLDPLFQGERRRGDDPREAWALNSNEQQTSPPSVASNELSMNNEDLEARLQALRDDSITVTEAKRAEQHAARARAQQLLDDADSWNAIMDRVTRGNEPDTPPTSPGPQKAIVWGKITSLVTPLVPKRPAPPPPTRSFTPEDQDCGLYPYCHGYEFDAGYYPLGYCAKADTNEACQCEDHKHALTMQEWADREQLYNPRHAVKLSMPGRTPVWGFSRKKTVGTTTPRKRHPHLLRKARGSFEDAPKDSKAVPKKDHGDIAETVGILPPVERTRADELVADAEFSAYLRGKAYGQARTTAFIPWMSKEADQWMKVHRPNWPEEVKLQQKSAAVNSTMVITQGEADLRTLVKDHRINTDLKKTVEFASGNAGRRFAPSIFPFRLYETVRYGEGRKGEK